MKMSRESALKKANDLRRVLLSYGVPEVKIHLKAGRPAPGDDWDSGFFVADMSHHTVSRYNSRNLTPVLAMCMNGRPSDGLPGPLCNGYGGWDLCYRIITMGYANHPGAGGPIVVPALTVGKFRIPKDSARRYAWGTEFEGGLNEKDWDRTLTNPRTKKRMTFREFMGRTNAALEEYLEIASGAHLEHSTWTNRKIDRLGYTAQEGVKEKQRYHKIVKNDPNPNNYWIDVSNLADQFQIAKGLEKGRLRPIFAVKQTQRALNRVQGAGLKVDGIVGRKTILAWEKFERTGKVSGRPQVPDMANIKRLLKNSVDYRR
jgi:hypothetical protein